MQVIKYFNAWTHLRLELIRFTNKINQVWKDLENCTILFSLCEIYRQKYKMKYFV